MPAVSYLNLLLPLLLVVSCIIGQGECNADRRRRQATVGDNRNIGDSNSYIPTNNAQFNPSNNQNNKQQLTNNLAPSSQGQGQTGRSLGFYNSPAFKPPTFSGDKPSGWFETKHQNWVSNQNEQLGKSSIVDGKNAAPSSLQADALLPRRDDGGAFFLQKVAKQYVSRGEKAYNYRPLNQQRDRGSVCINHQNFDGYTFGKFPCPLPAMTGMNQRDRFCCGPANYQYCCNEREYNLNQGVGFGVDGRHPKHPYYPPSRNRALAIILPIVGILVVTGALIIVFFYYKKMRNAQSKNVGSSKPIQSNEDYTAVSQVPPAEPPIPPRREQQRTTVQT